VDELESRMMSIPFYQRFCVGPDARVHMWYRRRSQLDVDRGPYKSAEAVLVAAARKELAHLEQFGRPLLPFQRERREAYGREEQLPSDHIKNLERYLLIASSLVPKNLALHHFRIRHPDSNQLKIVGLLDWQHASIPANMDELNQSEQSHAMALYYRRLVHSRYVKDTEEYNNLHHDAMTNPVSMLIYRLLTQAGG
ncbi:hypothetical protein J132_05629, partial [Termitomyces sp. J132]